MSMTIAERGTAPDTPEREMMPGGIVLSATLHLAVLRPHRARSAEPVSPPAAGGDADRG